jgi:hypothetical protein
MKSTGRASRPFWLVPERLFPHPELGACAMIVLAMLLVEVWQTSHMAQISVTIGQTRSELQQAEAQLGFARADADRRTTRAELLQLGNQMGMAATSREQVWRLPSEYLADDRTAPRDETPVPVFALAERVSGAIVPEATARGRVTR